jgi:hypothetical protein
VCAESSECLPKLGASTRNSGSRSTSRARSELVDFPEVILAVVDDLQWLEREISARGRVSRIVFGLGSCKSVYAFKNGLGIHASLIMAVMVKTIARTMFAIFGSFKSHVKSDHDKLAPVLVVWLDFRKISDDKAEASEDGTEMTVSFVHSVSSVRNGDCESSRHVGCQSSWL